METTGLDNANNPFTLSNGATTNEMDNMISTQKGEGLLLNLTDNFKRNGTDLTATDFFTSEKSNGKRPASEFDEDDDFGPESNVDAVDDVLSPTSKKYEDNIFDDKAFEGHFNPFMEHQEKAALETEKILQKKENEDDEDGVNEFERNHNHDNEKEEGFDEEIKEMETTSEKEDFQSEFQQQLEDTQRLAREETPTPPADTVHNVSGLVDNAAESESEDEWNYIKGEVADKENIPPQPEKEVAEIPEEDDSMSQLNPNAAEFVPVSPTTPGPKLCRLLNDEVISQSPSRVPQEIIDISLPNPNDFEKEVKSRPSEVDSFNGHDDELDKSSDSIDTLLNGKNIDEIPEFQPGSTPKKIISTEEFHFGPNAVQFTPAKLFDQSEAGLSTKAVFGDESVATIGTSFNESSIVPEASLLNKESDPMSMSFYEERDNNLFDLNKVQIIPDNIEEFLKQPDVINTSFNETISDLPEHHPLGAPETVEVTVTMNNDDAIQVTDLDKHSYDDEKELASPLEPEKELIGEEDSEPIKTPEPTHENLLGTNFCCIPKQNEPSDDLFTKHIEIVSNEIESDIATEVDDLLKTETITLPPDVEMIPPELPSETNRGDLVESKSPAFVELESDIVCERPASKSSAISLEAGLITEKSESGSLMDERPESESLDSERPESGSQMDEQPESEPLGCTRPESHSPVCEQPLSKSPACGIPETNSPVSERPESKSSVGERLELNSPICERPDSKSPFGERPESHASHGEGPESESSLGERPESHSSLGERPESQSSLGERPESTSSTGERPESQSSLRDKPEESEASICEKPDIESHIDDKLESKSPVLESLIQNATFDRPISTSPLIERPQSDTPICVKDLSLPGCPLPASNVEFEQLDIQKSPIPNETDLLTEDFTSSQQIEEAQKHFEELCQPEEKLESPQEDVTSSIKDDMSSPSPDHLIQESQETVQTIKSINIPDTEVNSSLIDICEPPPVEEIAIKLDIVDQNFTLPVQTQGEEIDVKTDKITPEFAEQAVITPSEESKQEEIPAIAVIQELSKEGDVKLLNDETIIGVAAATTALGVTAAAVAAAKTPETKVSEKKGVTSATKKPTPKVGSASKTTKVAPLSTPSSRLSGSKAAAPKTGLAKPPLNSSSSRITSSATKQLTAKPKTPTATPKSTEKKPLANGDIKSSVKSTVKSTLATKKEITATKTVSSTTKLSPTKTTTTKTTPTLKPTTLKTNTAPKPFTAKPAPTKPAVSAPKRPTTLSTNKTSATSTIQAKTTSSTALTAKPSLTKTSPKAPIAPRPKPATATTAASKPRVPLTRTVAKAPVTDKQIKERANIITASKSVTGTITNKTVGPTRVVASSTVRKIESKTSATRTTISKMTTMKSTTAKKPAEIVRNGVNKTKTTKIEKPKENGESTIVTQELTSVVHTTNNSIVVVDDPQLAKDNSPMDNKLIIDSFVETNALVD